MMRLLMIGSDTAAAGGIQGAFYNTLRGFHRFWERIDVICPFVPELRSPMLFGNVHFHPLPPGRLRSPLAIVRQGWRLAREQKPDLLVIHAYGMQLMSWGGWLLARRLGRPFIVEIHHIEGLPRAAEWRDHLRHVAALMFLRAVRHTALSFRVVNREALPTVLRQSAKIPPDKITTIYSVYLDRTIFHPMPQLPKSFDLIFVGRLVPNKGLDILRDAFRLLKKKMPRTTFLMVGRGPLQRRVLAAFQGIDGFHYREFLPSPHDLARAYNQARVVVCASYAEGGPRYVIEAMACGLPVVATPVGLMQEVVRDGETGYLVHDWSPQAIADRAEKLLGNPDLYRKCSDRARAVASRFDYNTTIAAYASSYQQLVQS